LSLRRVGEEIAAVEKYLGGDVVIQDRIEMNISGGLDFQLPRMISVRVTFDCPELNSIDQAIVDQFKKPGICEKIKPGQSIAIGCGSRGIANIADVTKAVSSEIKALGAHPFIFPAMGSHGAATAEGQVHVLENYGITEDFVGCPIRATMDVEIVDTLPDGTRIFMDRYAAGADGVVLIARIKPHTDFQGTIESGIVKMMTIGMGKIAGATELHNHPVETFKVLLPNAAREIMSKKPFLFGVGLIENARKKIALIEAVPAEILLDREPELLRKSRELMPTLLFETLDVLVVDEMGKEISGSGMDTNVTGRNFRQNPWNRGPDLQRLVCLSLSEKTGGNAIGLGMADIITMRLFRQIDFGVTYTNTITNTYLDAAAIPLTVNTDEEAIRVAVKTLRRIKPEDARIVRIKNTLQLNKIEVSEPLLNQVKVNPQMEPCSDPGPFAFDLEGNLILG
jgi:hypothetical protein